jgi:hypothetical protein
MARVPGAGHSETRRARSVAGRHAPPTGTRDAPAVAGRRAVARRGATVVALGGVLAAAALAAVPARATADPATPTPATAARLGAVPAFSDSETWEVHLPAQVVESSPILDTIGGTKAAVVGATNGKVYALGLAHGGEIRGWPVTTPGAAPIDSSPSVNGTIVYVGTGDASDPSTGGYTAINANGTIRWFRRQAARPGTSAVAGVQASMTVGTLQGTKAVVAGTLGQYEDAMHASGGQLLPGYPWFAADSEFSTPSIVDLYGTGHNDIVEGGESTAGNAYGVQYSDGGHIRVLAAGGNTGSSEPSGGLVCQYNTTQGVESSPAVGRFLRGDTKGIVVGTGITYQTASDSDQLIAITPHCGLAWKASLDGSTLDSPALVDALGYAGHVQVAEGTSNHGSGTVYLLDGADGKAYWSHAVGGEVIGGITSANLGAGHQDLLVPTTNGLYILDGRTGRQIALLGHLAVALQSSPLVTDDADGRIGITVAGYDNSGGEVIHFEIAGTQGSLAREAGAWPMFHDDPQLTGTAIPPARS